MADLDGFDQTLRASREASQATARVTGGDRAYALLRIAESIEDRTQTVLAANRRDLDDGRTRGLGDALLDRLRLDADRVSALSSAVRHIAELTDPIGQVVRGHRLPNGLNVEEVRVPFGVVAAIYEARPNVTVDIAALALKSGNACVLRGGSAAQHSNRALVEAIQYGLTQAGLPEETVQSVDEFGRDGASRLMTARGLVDVLIPRGSASLIETVVRDSTVPVIETGAGIVHIYVDGNADIEQAAAIVTNAKSQRPSVCNATETLLIHRDAAAELFPPLMRSLADEGVTVRGDERARSLHPTVAEARADEWVTEHLCLELGVRVVESMDEALDHIARYSTHHTEAIITRDVENAERFLAEVDSAVVMVNASTRFTDGGAFGFGAEVGISTQKMHARGPMGVSELTSTKWLVRGQGQIRE